MAGSGTPELGVGDRLEAVVLSPCVGGLVRTWSDRGTRLWSVDGPELHEAMCQGVLARTPREARRFREVGLMSEERGVLVLQPRFPDDRGTEQVTFRTSVIQLGPPRRPTSSTMSDLLDAVDRAIRFAIVSDGFVFVEKGGWDAPDVPFCLFIVDDGKIHIETQPLPYGSKSWEAFVTPRNEGASVSAPWDDETMEAAPGLILDAVGTWGLAPWDLALTYGVR